MRKLAILPAAALGLVGFASSAAWACDWGGYHQSRAYGYSYAPRSYGYSTPAYAYRTAYLDDDAYDYDDSFGYSSVAVGVDVVRNRRFHRRDHRARTAVNVGERDRGARFRERTAARGPGERAGSALRGPGSGEGGRAGAAAASPGMGSAGIGGGTGRGGGMGGGGGRGGDGRR